MLFATANLLFATGGTVTKSSFCDGENSIWEGAAVTKASICDDKIVICDGAADTKSSICDGENIIYDGAAGTKAYFCDSYLPSQIPCLFFKYIFFKINFL